MRQQGLAPEALRAGAAGCLPDFLTAAPASLRRETMDLPLAIGVFVISFLLGAALYFDTVGLALTDVLRAFL